MDKTYHGWVVVEEQGKGLNDCVYVEYRNARGVRDRAQMGFGNGGCIRAIEWWDKKLGTAAKLEPTIKGCFRVYTEVTHV